MANQLCDVNQDAYRNQSPLTIIVTLSFTEGCKDADSIVEVHKTKCASAMQPVRSRHRPGHAIQIFTFDVPPAGMIMFKLQEHLCRQSRSRHVLGIGVGDSNGPISRIYISIF